jgi:hypothetical protein
VDKFIKKAEESTIIADHFSGVIEVILQGSSDKE